MRSNRLLRLALFATGVGFCAACGGASDQASAPKMIDLSPSPAQSESVISSELYESHDSLPPAARKLVSHSVFGNARLLRVGDAPADAIANLQDAPSSSKDSASAALWLPKFSAETCSPAFAKRVWEMNAAEDALLIPKTLGVVAMVAVSVTVPCDVDVARFMENWQPGGRLERWNREVFRVRLRSLTDATRVLGRDGRYARAALARSPSPSTSSFFCHTSA